MPALLGGTGIIGKDIFVKMKSTKERIHPDSQRHSRYISAGGREGVQRVECLRPQHAIRHTQPREPGAYFERRERDDYR